MLKYEFTGNIRFQMYNGVNDELRSIRALRDIPVHGVKAGDLGGWIAVGSELSQEGDAWISGNSYLYRDTKVSGDVLIKESYIYESNIHGEGIILCSNVLKSNLHQTDFNRVEHSLLSHVEAKEALLEMDSSALKHVEVKNTVLKMKESNLKSLGECPLVILTEQKRFIMTGSEVFIETDHPDHARVHHNVTINNVNVKRGEALKMLAGFEPFKWENLILKNMKIHHGHVYPSKEKGYSHIAGTESERILIKDSYFQSQSSMVKGNVQLKGSIMLEKSTIKGMSSLVNHGKGELSLRNIRLKEMASIIKESEFALELQNKSYGAEDVVVLG